MQGHTTILSPIIPLQKSNQTILHPNLKKTAPEEEQLISLIEKNQKDSSILLMPFGFQSEVHDACLEAQEGKNDNKDI